MGSLFKLRDYWSTRFADEEFDLRSMTVENLDQDPTGAPKIALGSFQGNFRLLAAKQKGYQADDVLFEMNVGAPILQVGNGLVSPTGGRSTILLTPRKLIIGTFQRNAAAAAANDPLQRVVAWKLESEIVLEHTGYNFVVGAFGSQRGGAAGAGAASGLEQICVQSMDGQLAFFDIRKLLFARFLPSKSYMCPGALMYMPVIDALFTCTSTFELECYRILNLASSTASETKEQQQGRKLTPDWSMVVGEDAVDMCVCRLSAGLPANQLEIAVLLPHTLILLKEDGTMNWNKRLEGFAACMTAYPMPGGANKHQLLIATHSQQILVLGESGVMWNAKAPTVPLSLFVAPFCGTQGMIAVLGDNGSVSVNYLGTDPANNPIPALESKDLDYDAMDEELRRLQQVVRQASLGTRQEPRDVIRTGVSTATLSHQHGGRRHATAGLRLEYTGPSNLENITVTINTALPIRAEPSSITVPFIGRGEVFDTTLHFSISDIDGERFVTPSSLIADVVVCYNAPTGEPLIAKTALVLPLALVAMPLAVGKTSDFKIQLETNRNPVDLARLFEDFISTGGGIGIEHNPNLVSVQFANGADASILASKNGGRYRVQGSSFDALWIITSELVRRLRVFFKREGGEELVVDHSEPLPLDDYVTVINAHLEARKELSKARDRLSDRSQQFRAIQKRLLVRFRERNPAPLNSLNLLFEETYRQVLEAGETADAAQAKLDQRAGALTCATHLLLIVVRAKCHATMSVEDFDALRHYLSPNVPNSTTPSQYGWEEATDAGMLHLLKTTLSKSGKAGDAAVGAPPTLELPADTTKLVKHLTTVLDRVQKGASLVENLAQKRRAQDGGAASPNAEE